MDAYRADTLWLEINHLLYTTQISKDQNSYTHMLFATCCLKKTAMQCMPYFKLIFELHTKISFLHLSPFLELSPQRD